MNKQSHRALVASVAKGIAKTYHGGADISDHYLFGEATGGKVFVDAATAAIAAVYEALREPSEGMLGAMYEAMFDDKYDGTQAVMVGSGYDAALAASPIVQEE